MVSVVKESSRDVFANLSDQLGGVVLKEEQKLAVEALLSGKDVMAVLPTGFGRSILYQSFVIAKKFANKASVVVVVPLRSIIEDQLQSNDFGLKAVAFLEDPNCKIITRHWWQLVQCNFRIRGTSFVFSFPLFPASPQAPSTRLLQFFRARLFRATSRLSRKGLLEV